VCMCIPSPGVVETPWKRKSFESFEHDIVRMSPARSSIMLSTSRISERVNRRMTW